MTPKFFGREPALWMALIASAIMFFSGFVFPLTPDQQGTLNAIVVAAFGLFTAWSVASDGLQAAILGFLKAILALAISFGLNLPSDKQAIIMTLAATVTALFIRQTSVAPVASDNVERSPSEVRLLAGNLRHVSGAGSPGINQPRHGL